MVARAGDRVRAGSRVQELTRKLSVETTNLRNCDPAPSEKTVRNHASNIFDKLGVWSRAQAIVFARDRGFRA
jgi:hypothetical protein